MRLLLIVLAASVAAACAPGDADIRRARLVAERRNLEATLDGLEDRLIASQARVRFWREMRDRHESATAIACASLGEHAAQMAARSLPVERTASLHRSRVARAEVAPEGEVQAAAYGGQP